MRTSYPLPGSCMVTFRCAEYIKEQMTTFAETHGLTASEVIRQALEQFMQQAEPAELGDNAASGSNEATLAVIARMEPPIKRNAAVHHHIAFLNRELHDYHGFRFAVQRQKHLYQRYFSVKKYGSKAAALAAAMNRRDEVLEQLEHTPSFIETICKRA